MSTDNPEGDRERQDAAQVPKRGFWSRLYRPDPAPEDFAQGRTIPQSTASFPNRLLYHWLTSLLKVGYTRPLEKGDLWVLDDPRLTSGNADRLERAFYTRCPPEKRPAFLRDEPSPNPNNQAKEKNVQSEKSDLETAESATIDGQSPNASDSASPEYDESLLWAANQVVFKEYWTAGGLQLVADVITACIPLLTRELLEFLTNSYYHARLPTLFPSAPSIGVGFGWAFGIFALQCVSSMCTNHALSKSMSAGMVVRSSVTGLIFRKALRLSNRARVVHTPGKITTMISADAPRLEAAAQYGHYLWVGLIQLILGIGLLISTLGYSALVGVGVIFFSFPVQGLMVLVMYQQRTKATAVMDKRVRLLQEVLNGIRVIKVFAWENFFAQKINIFRRSELKHIRKLSIALSGLFSSVTVAPVMAAILSFIVYSLTGHSLDPPVIFASLQYFNIIRIPLILIPFVLGAVGDAVVAAKRITPFLLAEELLEPYTIDPNSSWAVDAEGDFTWESLTATEEAKKETEKNEKDGKEKQAKEKNKKKGKNKDRKKGEAKNGTKEEKKEDEEVTEPEKPPFELKNLQFRVAKGAFAAIVGKVGSGKSSIAQALIGEMRRTRGQTTFSGTVAYLPQTPWIMNATLRENILFGYDYDANRYQEVITACQLGPDIAILPHGDGTEIGEKGISLSGGTKARVSLARAAYSYCDAVILDDTLSAVDAHVGKAILEECLLTGPLSNRTRILVTHALHVLPHVDVVFVVDEGKITEQGPYKELLTHGGAFSRLIEEFGNERKDTVDKETGEASPKKQVGDTAVEKDIKENKGIMQEEERNTGAVKGEIYKKYLVAAGGISWAPVFLFLLVVNEAANVATNLFLGFWTSRKISQFENKDYMGVYAGLGAGNAFATFCAAYCFCIAGLRASYHLHSKAFQSVLKSPTSFFDTSPTGRIVARFSRDTEVLDSELALGFFSLTLTFFSIFGIAGLIFYTFPYLGILFLPLGILYYITALYYRRTSVETKRLDSLLRSTLFAVYSEALSGLATLRASRREAACTQTVEQAVDHQNRAHIINVILRSWLGVRLDAFGNLLILGIALFAVGLRKDVDPSKVGVVLSYSLAITWNFSELVNQYATLEQNMNCVERVMYYADELPAEKIKRNTSDPAISQGDPKWPSAGKVVFKDVKMRYREGLPMVLKGASFEVKAGEKVGVVGRTGAGKSSLLQILLRIVEIEEGAVEIDGVDIRDVELETLRRNIAVIPQDVKLFQGTLRDNLDPLKTMTDADLIAALRLASLVSSDTSHTTTEALPIAGTSQIPSSEKISVDKFTLETEVESEGSNFSAGEGQLIALSRALAKGSKIVLLDEATSSVDVETDSRIQSILASSSSTLLTIAHRLNTVAFYDRILVVDKGLIREFDEPLALFDRGPWNEEKPGGSLFRNLCDEAGLTRDDIVKIRNRLRS